MTSGTIIGLTGLAGAGKGVVADYLVEKHGFTKLSFAGPLKKMLRTLNPIMGSQLALGDSGAEPTRLSHLFDSGMTEAELKQSPLYGPEYRRLLQVLGTDCIRAVDEHFWVSAAMRQIDFDSDTNYVFDDVRFPNEAREVKQFGTLWHINRPGHDGGGGSHASEMWAGKMGEHTELLNIGTIADLHQQVDSILRSLNAA